jgi:hypothetical protein
VGTTSKQKSKEKKGMLPSKIHVDFNNNNSNAQKPQV